MFDNCAATVKVDSEIKKLEWIGKGMKFESSWQCTCVIRIGQLDYKMADDSVIFQ